MKSVLRIATLMVLIAALFITYKYEIRNPWGLLIFMAGGVARQFVSKDLWDPIFEDQSALSWALGLFKKKRKLRVDIPKYDI